MSYFTSKLNARNALKIGALKHFVCLASSMALLSSCTMIPDLSPFNPFMPAHYPQEEMAQEAADKTAQETGPKTPEETLAQSKASARENLLHAISWQRYYQDKTLKTLIQTGLANNSDLKIAAYRISEARALYGIENSALIPDVNAGGSFIREKSNQSNNAAGAQSFIYQNYAVNLGITDYEIDFFGRIRSLKDAALNEYLSTISAHKTAHITLISEIAAAYTSLRANQALLNLAESTFDTRKESFSIIKKRADAGISTDLELAQAQTLLLQARVDRFKHIDAIAKDKNALRLLLGSAEALPDLAPLKGKSNNALLDVMTGVPVGLPSELLTSRPDIIAAEHSLRSANADIGAARAAFFPRISLTGTGGYASADISSLFESGAQVWRFFPQISVPIFTGGRLQKSLDLAEIRKDIAIIQYEKTIQTAFRDVSDALSTVKTYDERIGAQQDLVKAAARRATLSQKRYDAGIENYLTVLDAKRALYEAQQALIVQRGQEISGKIALYKAVGGGITVLSDKR